MNHRPDPRRPARMSIASTSPAQPCLVRLSMRVINRPCRIIRTGDGVLCPRLTGLVGYGGNKPRIREGQDVTALRKCGHKARSGDPGGPGAPVDVRLASTTPASDRTSICSVTNAGCRGPAHRNLGNVRQGMLVRRAPRYTGFQVASERGGARDDDGPCCTQ